MDKYRVRDAAGASFRVFGGTARSQAAAMTLAAGQVTGGPHNRHPASDQWLYVVSGSGETTVDGRTMALEAGDLLLIAAGEAHEIRAFDQGALVTLNVYAPPEY
ncbi:MAG: cupin domain-containing protein [Trueperaceae bacterium]